MPMPTPTPRPMPEPMPTIPSSARLALAMPLALLMAANAPPPVTGRWVTADKSAVVSIAPCGARLCGRIESFLVPPPAGVDQRDTNNRSPALRTRRILGMNILEGFALKDGAWQGTIYDPKSGRSYRSVLTRGGGNTLRVRGCLGILCQTQVWTAAR